MGGIAGRKDARTEGPPQSVSFEHEHDDEDEYDLGKAKEGQVKFLSFGGSLQVLETTIRPLARAAHSSKSGKHDPVHGRMEGWQDGKKTYLSSLAANDAGVCFFSIISATP
jgi:hypothetical protein